MTQNKKPELSSTAIADVASAYRALGNVLDEFARMDEIEVEQHLASEQGPADGARLGLLAKEMLNERRLRDRIIPQAFFGEPVWDLLLELFVAHSTRQAVTVTAACASALCPPTTALRYIDQLEAKGLIARTRSSHDGRMVHIELTARCLGLMHDYLSRIHERRLSKRL